MTFQVDITQRAKERPAGRIVLEQVSCLNWLLGKVPAIQPISRQFHISHASPVSTLYPRFSTCLDVLVCLKTQCRSQNSTMSDSLESAHNPITQMLVRKKSRWGKEKIQWTQCGQSSHYLSLSLTSNHLSSDTIAITVRPMSNWAWEEDGGRCPTAVEESQSGKLRVRAEH